MSITESNREAENNTGGANNRLPVDLASNLWAERQPVLMAAVVLPDRRADQGQPQQARDDARPEQQAVRQPAPGADQQAGRQPAPGVDRPPAPAPLRDAPIPAPDGRPLTVQELVVGRTVTPPANGNDAPAQPQQRHGLGSTNYHERQRAHNALATMGVSALPQLDRILNPVPPNDLTPAEQAARGDREVTVRAAQIRDRISNDLPRLMRDLGSNNELTSLRASNLLRGTSTDRVLDMINQNRNDLNPEQFQRATGLVRERLSDQQLEQLYLGGGGKGSFIPHDEASLRRALLVGEMLNKDTTHHAVGLANILANGSPANVEEARRLFQRGVQSQDRELVANSQAGMAVVHFRQGRPAEGIAALHQSMTGMQAIHAANGWVDMSNMGTAIGNIRQHIATNNVQLSPEQQQQIGAVENSMQQMLIQRNRGKKN